MAKDSLQEVTAGGAFKRTDAEFRSFVAKGEGSRHQPEAGRYHLIVSHACPWANRCLAVRALKGLDDVIGSSVVHPTWGKSKPDIHESKDSHYGWIFNTGAMQSPKGFGSFTVQGCDESPPIFGDATVRAVRDIYEMSVKGAAKYTVPILYDKKLNEIVSNESSEIIRMLTTVFDDFATGPGADLDLYPEDLRPEIDEVNEWIYHTINNGVYRCGFAKSQEAYEEAITGMYESLDRLEGILSTRRFLCGSPSRLTEADVRLFMTLARFDEVYVVYFKCNIRRISDYPKLRQYCRDMYQLYGGKIGETIHMDHIKTHYYTSHASLNPYAVIPVGPNAEADFKLPPEGRESLN